MTENRQRKLLGIVAAVLIFSVFAVIYSGGRKVEPISATAFKLNTVVKVTIYDSRDEKILQDAIALCDTYEKIFSRTLNESELYRFNHGMLPEEEGWITVSEPFAELVKEGLSYSRLSDGAFDISIAPLSSQWDFTSGEKVIPEAEELEKASALVNYEDVLTDGNKIRLEKEGMQLELGAIAKGYIADRIKDFLVEKGVKSAIIDLGGNVLCVGKRPDKEPFRIGVQKPFATRNQTIGTAEISDRSIVSSGIYERYFEKDGVLYHHILNPQDGYPYHNGLVAVTIFSDTSVEGDALSTSCFALGLEKGMELINRLPNVQAIFISEDGKLHYSKDFEKELKLIDL